MTPELQLLLALAIIISVAKFAGHLCQRYLNQPVVFGELLAGVVLGPTLLNLLGWPIFHGVAPGESHQPVSVWVHDHITSLSSIGVLLLMFIAGLETDLLKMRTVGKAATVTAVMGVILPLGLGALVSRLFGMGWTEAIFLGTVLTATSVSITAQTLMEIRQLHSKEGVTILGAAVIDDILGILVLALVIAFGASHTIASDQTMHVRITDHLGMQLATVLPTWVAPQAITITLTLLGMTLFFWLAVHFGRQRLPRLLEWASRLHASYAVPAAALVLIFGLAILAEYLGQVAAITGAYLVGVFIGRTRFVKEVEHGIHPFTYIFFVPIFLISIGLGVNARELGNGSLLFTAVIVVVAILSKIVGCGLGAVSMGFTRREALRTGIGMVSRGEVGLIVAQVGLASGIIHTSLYATIVIMVLATTVVTPVLLRWSFPKVQEEQTDVYESVVGIEKEEETSP